MSLSIINIYRYVCKKNYYRGVEARWRLIIFDAVVRCVMYCAVTINHYTNQCAFCFYVRQLRTRRWSFWLPIVCVSQYWVGGGHHHPPPTIIDLLRISVHTGKTGRTSLYIYIRCRPRFFIPHNIYLMRFRWCPADGLYRYRNQSCI